MGATAGIYRGVCVDTADPERLGRIRVQVPQLLGTSASGWALPAWSLHDLTIWPEDRLPKPGQGVWVMFEGPDRLTWTSVFGPQEESQQFLDDDPDNYITATALILPSLVVGLSVPVVGTVRSPAGAPEDGLVTLQRADSQYGPWSDLAGPVPVQRNGTWSVDLVPDAGHLDDWFRASFVGKEPYTASDSDAVQNTPGTLATDLSMTSPSSPSEVRWQEPTVFGGFLLYNNLPMADRLVVLLARPLGAVDWITAGSAITSRTGSWNVAWTRQGLDFGGQVEVTAYFAGGGDYMLDFAPDSPMLLPPVDVETTITVEPITLVHGQVVEATGILSSPYGAPYPDPRVVLSVQTPSALEGPSQSVQAVNAVLVPEDDHLRWVASWQATSVSADFTASFAGTWVYGPSTATEQVLQSRAVAPENLQLPTLSLEVPFTATASMKDVHGQVVEVGSAVLQHKPSGGSWADYGDPAPVGANGLWSAPQQGYPTTGTVDWRVRYLDNPDQGLLEGFGASLSRDVQPAAPVLAKGEVTHTSAAFSWEPVPAALEYEVMRGGSLIATTADTSYSDTGLSNDGTYTYTVRATDGSVYGPPSAGITARTGRPEVRKQGSFQRTEKITSSGTWRPDLNRWVQDSDYGGASYGDMLMGYFSSSAATNYGVCNYNSAGFRNWVSATYGSDVLSKLSWDRARLYMHRSDSSHNGSTRATPIILYVTHAIPRSSKLRPYLAGGANIGSWNRQAAGVGNYAKTVDLPYPWWAKHVLMNEKVSGLGGYACRGFAIYQNSKTNYSRYIGRRSTETIAAQLTVNCSWNFVTVSYVAPTWV